MLISTRATRALGLQGSGHCPYSAQLYEIGFPISGIGIKIDIYNAWGSRGRKRVLPSPPLPRDNNVHYTTYLHKTVYKLL